MNRNIISGAMLIAILALASCSTQKLASNQHVDDDVYFTKAKAGEQVPMQIAYNQNVYTTPQDNSGTYSDDDYYYYDSYASRINRFSYNSPFNYYDDYYYDYASTPTSGGYAGYDTYGYGGFGLGVGIGFGYGGYYGYSPFGIGWGGGYPFWGIYSAYGYGGYYGGYYGGGYGYGYGGGYRGTPRPYRGSGQPGAGYANRSVRGVGYNGAYQNAGYYPGRAVNSNGRRITTNGYGNSNGNYNNGQGRQTRPTRTDYPTYQPTRSTNSMPSSSGNSGGGNSGGGGGGGSRPVRP